MNTFKSESFTPMRVGLLAKSTGISIRTLHYYDEIGLLQPSLHSEGGHRLYAAEDVVRLQRILSLRAVGLALDEIKECMDGEDFSPRRTLELHIERLNSEIEVHRQLRDQLMVIAQRMDRSEDISPAEFIIVIEAIEMSDKYFNENQRSEIAARAQKLGADGLRAAENEWSALMEKVRAEMNAGTDPKDPLVVQLANEWMKLVTAFTGGDPGITSNLETMYKEEQRVAGMMTADVRDMMAYIAKAQR